MSIWNRRRDDVLDEIVESETKKHARTLRVQIMQRRIVDAYGNEDASKASEQVQYFMTNVIFREYQARGFDASLYKNKSDKLQQVFKRILAIVADDIRANPSLSMENVQTGQDYEQYCRTILEAHGWSVSTTPATGDQGADLIARKGTMRVVLQCKFYSSPVGNSAVQEVQAAKAFQGASTAAVVSNAEYTTFARQLAAPNRVLLLHHNDLSRLEALIEGRSN